MRAFRATPSSEWVKTGDMCYSQAGMQGVVLRVLDRASGKTVVVLWANGFEGRCSITAVRRTEVAGTEGQLDHVYDTLIARFLAQDFADDARLDGSARLRDELIATQTAIRERIGSLRNTSFVDG